MAKNPAPKAANGGNGNETELRTLYIELARKMTHETSMYAMFLTNGVKFPKPRYEKLKKSISDLYAQILVMEKEMGYP